MSSPPPSNDTPVAYSALINAKIVVLETVTANKKNKKALMKKTMKNKQFMHKFEVLEANYMNRFLKTHHIQKYHAATNHTFTFKIQVPLAKYK